MLTTARPVGSYRSVAGAVRTLLFRSQHGEPTSDELDVDRIDAIRELLALGSQFGPKPLMRLDTNPASSPARLNLAQELAQLAQPAGQQNEDFNMGDWVKQATEVLDALRGRQEWDSLTPGQRTFALDQLEPFLRRLLEMSPEIPEW